MERCERKRSLEKYQNQWHPNNILFPSPPPFIHSYGFCLLKHFSTDLFSPLSFLFLSVYTEGKKRYTTIFMRMLTEGGCHLCKLSEIVTSSLPPSLSENLTSQIIYGTLLSITFTTILPLAAPLQMIDILQSKHAFSLPERSSLIKQTSCIIFKEVTSQHQQLI